MVPNGSAYANYPSFANNGAKTPPGGSPESAKYALGMVPADTFPAEWANWFFHGATAGITRLNTDVGSIKKEINSVLAAYNITPDATSYNQLYTAIEKRLTALSQSLTQSFESELATTSQSLTQAIATESQSLTQTFRSELATTSQSLTQAIESRAQSLYPVGTIYRNRTNPANPATLLGFGSWAQINDAFLACASADSYAIGVPRFNGLTSGGAYNVTLSDSNIPPHAHYFTPGGDIGSDALADTKDNRTSGMVDDNGAASPLTYGTLTLNYPGDGSTPEGSSATGSISAVYGAAKVAIGTFQTSIGLHSFSISIPHRHLAYFKGYRGATEYTGGGTPFTILPPYQAVYTWYRYA